MFFHTSQCFCTISASKHFVPLDKTKPPFSHFDAPNPMQLNWVISQLVVCCEKFLVYTFDAMASDSVHMMSLVRIPTKASSVVSTSQEFINSCT